MDSYSTLWTRYVNEGDEEAFEQVFSSLVGAVVRFLQANPTTRNAAEDLAQGIFLELIKNKKALDPTLGFEAWRYFYVRKRTTDCGRRYQRDLKILAEPGPSPDSIAPEDRLGLPPRQEDSIILNEAVSQLPDRERKIFQLRRVAGLTIPEIVERLGDTTYDAVSMRLHRAEVTLRRLLMKN